MVYRLLLTLIDLTNSLLEIYISCQQNKTALLEIKIPSMVLAGKFEINLRHFHFVGIGQ